jgi:hypothetical protein
MPILVVGDNPSIRAAIDVTLTSKDLNDTIMALDIYRNAADQDVYNVYADADSAAGEDINRVKRAAIYFAAARLCPVVVRATSITARARDTTYTRPAFVAEERAETLRGMAILELNEVLTPDDETAAMPTMFAIATGQRGL